MHIFFLETKYVFISIHLLYLQKYVCGVGAHFITKQTMPKRTCKYTVKMLIKVIRTLQKLLGLLNILLQAYFSLRENKLSVLSSSTS